jgi:taurine dioxygenase/pentalenolactone F synthase
MGKFYYPDGNTSSNAVRKVVGSMKTNRNSQLLVEPLAAPLGAIVRGLTFSDSTSPELVEEVEQAIGQHQVLVFRGHQQPTDAQFAEFTSHFGVRNVKTDDKIQFTKENYPEIVLISNVIANGKPIGTAGSNKLFWHADLAWSRENVRFGFLDAVEVPAEGGNTLFANGYAALESLSPDERSGLDNVEIYHLRGGQAYPKPGETSPDPGLMRRQVVVTNPATGRRALFLSQLRGGSARERAVDQSNADLVEALSAHLESPRFVYEHHWQVGDLVMWDQIGTVHARQALRPERRILRQVTVKVPYTEEALWGSPALSRVLSRHVTKASPLCLAGLLGLPLQAPVFARAKCPSLCFYPLIACLNGTYRDM